MTTQLDKLQLLLGYKFNELDYLKLALTHRSMGHTNNERLEFLGDAILDLVITDELYHRFPEASEGELTRARANLVKKATLAKIARKLQLGNFITLGSGEKKSGGWRRDSTLANTVEAIIGAVYLDSGFELSGEFILDIYTDLLKDLTLQDQTKDPKTQLQEFLQAQKKSLPEYRVIDEKGLAHEREFTVECEVEILPEPVVAVGRSKQIAEQTAAEKALRLIQLEK